MNAVLEWVPATSRDTWVAKGGNGRFYKLDFEPDLPMVGPCWRVGVRYNGASQGLYPAAHNCARSRES
jgi:hypothetical protein